MAVALHKDGELAAHWKTQIEQSVKELNSWHKRGEKISKTYRDERDDQDKGANRRLNLFWANTETLKPAIYSKTPVPICERRFLDKDTTGRVASTILERVLRYEVSMSGFDNAVRRARNDYLLPGRGQVWIRYYPQFGEPVSPEQTADNDLTKGDGTPIDEDDQAKAQEEQAPLVSETLCVDYVHWQDYGTLPALARTEDEVEGKYRRIYMSRSDLIEHFGEDIGKEIELDHAPSDGIKNSQATPSTVTGQEGMQATVYEIWWKPERKVYFIAKSYDKICKEVDDPLKLEGFFPCPMPLNAVMTNDSTIPVPFFAESQDQYFQIDDLTRRIDVLTAACKVVGAYDAASEGLKRVFQEATEPNLIPVDSYVAFREKGGIAGAIQLVDIKQIAEVLKMLIEVRTQIIMDLDRVTGINDVKRGEGDARETLGAQKLKNQNAGTRIQEQQDDMARFCRDIISIMGEIVSEQYSAETLITVSGAMNDEGLDPPASQGQQPPLMGHNGGPPLQSQPGSGVGTPPAGMPPQVGPPPIAGPPQPDPQEAKLKSIMEAIALLRQDKLRGFRIDIETDSTVQGDAQAEKESRVEFIKGVTDYMKMSAEVAAMIPASVPLLGKMLSFGVRGFRVGRDLESAIEDFVEKAELDAKQKALQPPQPSPEQIKAQSEQDKAQSEIERQKIENEGEQANNASDLESKKLDRQMKEYDLQIAVINANTERAKLGLPPIDVPMPQQDHIGRLHEIVKTMDETSKRNAVPKKIVRDPVTGKPTHVVPDQPDPNEHVNKLVNDIAAKLTETHQRNSAPKRVVRGADNKISHIVTET